VSSYYRLSPEVAGGLGEHTVMDRSQIPPVVTHLHYVFDGWLGDELIESYPCFVVTRSLADKIGASRLQGAILAKAEISTSREFDGLNAGRVLPEFLWLKVIGTLGESDFALERDARLVVSATALSLLRQGQLDHCLVEVWP
jgi:hypothetical protein